MNFRSDVHGIPLRVFHGHRVGLEEDGGFHLSQSWIITYYEQITLFLVSPPAWTLVWLFECKVVSG